MGIHYLTAFVDKHFKGWKRTLVKGKLIIDGHSLSYALFEEYSDGVQNDEIYGGDYVSIARQIDNFFSSLLEAGINPLVVIDGINPDDKADTIAERNKVKLKTVISLFNDVGTLPIEITKELESDRQRVGKKRSQTERKHARPFLLLGVVINSVKRVLGDDHLFVADGDADVDIACLAIHHHCPVLSQDSDFYVFPLLYGYIPYSKFYWRNAKNIYGEFYSYQLFCQQFEIHDTSLLTVIPAIVGNDTIAQMDETLLKIIVPEDTYTGNLTENAVKFVAHFITFDTCLTWLRQQKLFGMIKIIQDAYRDYLSLPLFKPRSSLATSIHCKDGSRLPVLLLKKYRKGDFFSFVIDALQIHKVRFSVVVEDVLSESWCRLIGVPIRSTIYSILCGTDACILESQRSKCATNFKEVEINSITHVTYDGEQIPLPTLQSCGSEIDAEYGKKILFGILDAREEDFNSDIPQDYQLLLAITRYWYKHCTVEKKEVLLKPFILLLQLSKENKLERYTSIGRPSAKYTEPPFRIASFAHAFAQWQTLYHDIKCLDELLQMPLKLPLVSDFLECSCLYSLVEATMKGGDLKVVEEYHLNQKTYQVFFAVTCNEQ